jgi:diguanylate cyclase (GGDEF)-like protein
VSLQRKTILSIALVTVGLLVVAYWVTHWIILDSYTALEHREMVQNLERARGAVTATERSMDSMLSGWATWDDTYRFMADRNPEYIASNLVDTTFSGMELNLIVYLDPGGAVVWGQGFDRQAGTATPLPEGILTHLAPDSPLTVGATNAGSMQGMVLIPAGPMLLAARPILTSEGGGPSRGVLVMGRLLDSAEATTLATTTRLTLSFEPLRQDPLPTGAHVASTATQEGSGPYVVTPTDQGTLSGTTTIADIYGRPAIMVRVISDRGIYQQGRSATLYLLAWLTAASIAFALVSMLLLDRVVLVRVRRLMDDVRTIRPGRDVGIRVGVSGSDEIASLGVEINQMIEALEDSQDEVTRQYEEASRMADLEPLTGLLNHRAFFRRAEEDVIHNQRSGDRFSLVMMDLDDFKLFNDVYGHQTGDEVLRQVGDLLRENVRDVDYIARYGGDEFVALLPSTDQAGAIAFAERVRDALTKRLTFTAERTAVPVYMSFGIAVFPEHGLGVDELLAYADANLYSAKQLGGDAIAGERLPTITTAERNSGMRVLEGLVRAVENKDHYTQRHSEEVIVYSLMIADMLDLTDETRTTLRLAGLFHDVGKIGVPDHILRKPGALEKEEFETIKHHAFLGELILKVLPDLHDVQLAVGAHHENFDGTGYPRGLRGDEIPLLGRILAVADTYAAMLSNRPYRTALDPDQAAEELRAIAGTRLDPALVPLLLSVPQGDDHPTPAAAPTDES